MADSKDPKNPIPPAAPAQPAEVKEPPKWLVKIKAIISTTAEVSKAIVGSAIIQKPKTVIKNFGLMGWAKVFIALFVGILTLVVYKTSPQWKKLWKLPYLSSFEPIADEKFSYASDTKVVRYSNDLLLPQHVVLVNKIVVNIKPGKTSTNNPMIAFDLYVRVDNEDAAVEIKEREKQIQDHLQRFCEGLQYDQIQTEDGKLTWKNRMKRELNLVLNTGKVKEVFFKTLLVKP